jgi:hypothetical protein
MERPDLGCYMREFSLLYPDNYYAYYPHANEADRRIVEEAVVKLGAPPLPSGWYIDYVEDKLKFWLLPVELALFHTPNLERLEISLGADWNLHLMDNLIRTRPPFFTQLKSLLTKAITWPYYDDDEDHSSTSPVSIARIDSLICAAPNLHDLYLPSAVYDISFPTTPLTNLRRLFFGFGCVINPKFLTEILSNAPELEFLALHWSNVPEGYYNIGDDRPIPGVWDIIEPCRHSLRELRLHIDEWLVDSRGGGTRESLCDFPRLEVLKVNNYALDVLYDAWMRKNRHICRSDEFLSSIFPPGIREVMFWDLCELTMLAAMQRFASISGVYRDLERVTVGPSEGDYDFPFQRPKYRGKGWVDVKAALVEEFARGGASFKYLEPGPRKHTDREIGDAHTSWVHSATWGKEFRAHLQY